MDRLKSARVSSGGRIEGISRVATTSLWSRLFGGGVVVPEEDTETEVDETLIWGSEKGSFRWEEVEGVDVQWGASGLGMVSVGRPGREAEVMPTVSESVDGGNGLDEVKRFLWDL
jgi:signal recognition particle receptor subunit beta